jgi:4-hydroxy-3-methylbut-2-enyl diphosphate reductase IspH
LNKAAIDLTTGGPEIGEEDRDSAVANIEALREAMKDLIGYDDDLKDMFKNAQKGLDLSRGMLQEFQNKVADMKQKREETLAARSFQKLLRTDPQAAAQEASRRLAELNNRLEQATEDRVQAEEAAKSVATIMLVHGTSNSMQIPKLLEMASKTMAHLCEPENHADVLLMWNSGRCQTPLYLPSVPC